jgi:choline kinase
MSQIDVLFLNAGRQTRFKSDSPKALAKTSDGESLFEKNIKSFRSFSEIGKIYNATSEQFIKHFESFDCINKIIPQGGGTGRAIYNFLNLGTEVSQDLILCWGDAYYSKELIEELLQQKTNSFPVSFKENPYVDFVFDWKGVEHVKFKNTRPWGFQDLSIFRVDKLELLYVIEKYLLLMDDKSEYNVLDTFNCLDTEWSLKPYISTFEVKGFNTQGELEHLVTSGSI